MRNLLRFIIQYQFIILFILIESFSLFLLFNSNQYQRFVFYKASRSITGGISGKLDDLRDYFSLSYENRELFDENTELHNRLARLSAFRVDTFSEDTGQVQYRYIPANVVNISVNDQYNFITLNKGSADSIGSDMAVISPEGIVGYIREVSENFAVVMPAINRDFIVSGKIRKNGYYGPVSWDGINTSVMTLSDIPYHVEVTAGDTIVTSGFARTFPEGIPIGTIENFSLKGGNYYEIKVKMFTDFRKLNYVHVIKYYPREEIDSLQNAVLQ